MMVVAQAMAEKREPLFYLSAKNTVTDAAAAAAAYMANVHGKRTHEYGMRLSVYLLLSLSLEIVV